jgi:hypothetical protein
MPVVVEKSGSRPCVRNYHTGAQLPPHDLQFPCRAAPQRRPVCTQTVTYVAHFFQANFELHPYDVEKWAASRWNHRVLKIGRRQLDLWRRLYIHNILNFQMCQTEHHWREKLSKCASKLILYGFYISPHYPMIPVLAARLYSAFIVLISACTVSWRLYCWCALPLFISLCFLHYPVFVISCKFDRWQIPSKLGSIAYPLLFWVFKGGSTLKMRYFYPILTKFSDEREGPTPGTPLWIRQWS